LAVFGDEPWYYSLNKLFYESDLDIGDITQACLSDDKSVLVIIKKGGYCIGPRVSQYLISENKLEEAITESPFQGCLSGSEKFDKVNGSTLLIKGWGGDAGCGSEMYYDYDPAANIVKLTKTYSGCEGDESYIWTYY
jgi:hypothetical protein